MNPELMYQTVQLERQLRLNDPAARHRRAARPRRLPPAQRDPVSPLRGWWGRVRAPATTRLDTAVT